MRNWAGNHEYRAAAVHTPRTLDELRATVSRAPRIRVLGTRHTFTAVGDSAELVSLADLPGEVRVEDGTVSVPAAMRYGELARVLEGHELALHNLASLPHISVGGAIATATHGSGERNGNLATAVAALELVTSEGDMVTARRGDPDFDGMVVHLGALGALTRVALDVEPAYEVRQQVYEGLEWDALFERFDEIFAAAYSVSVFTRYRDVEQVWLKSRDALPGELFGARPAAVERHPIIELGAESTTAQRGVPGAWWERLPHFRMGFEPSAGDEIQSEFLVPREHAVPAVRAVRELASAIAPLLMVSELRTVAADRLWMSPQYGQDTLGIHFTWVRDQADVERALRDVEAALAPFGARPHWGKLFLAAPRYERGGDFLALAGRLDPRGAFRNEWLEAHVA